MNERVVRFPVICPVCRQEILAESPVGTVAEALMRHAALPLTSRCHDVTWNAGEVEREQIREYLAAGVSADSAKETPFSNSDALFIL